MSEQLNGQISLLPNDIVEEDLKITETMSKEELEAYFANNREIIYKGVTLGIMDWENGTFDVIGPSNESEEGFMRFNGESFTTACEAVAFAVEYLDNIGKDNNKAKGKSKGKSKPKEEFKPNYDGPITVRVFGRDIYVEETQGVTYEQIREKLVNDYFFPNFKKEKVYYDFDASTGTLEVLLKFQQKG